MRAGEFSQLYPKTAAEGKVVRGGFGHPPLRVKRESRVTLVGADLQVGPRAGLKARPYVSAAYEARVGMRAAIIPPLPSRERLAYGSRVRAAFSSSPLWGGGLGRGVKTAGIGTERSELCPWQIPALRLGFNHQWAGYRAPALRILRTTKRSPPVG